MGPSPFPGLGECSSFNPNPNPFKAASPLHTCPNLSIRFNAHCLRFCCDACCLLSLQLLYLCADVYQQMSPKEARGLGKDIWHIFLDRAAVSQRSHFSLLLTWHLPLCSHQPGVQYLGELQLSQKRVWTQERETAPSALWSIQRSLQTVNLVFSAVSTASKSQGLRSVVGGNR